MHSPIVSPQSAGLGTNAGDQQYVCGIFMMLTMSGPTAAASASRLRSFTLHSLMTSPRLGKGQQKVLYLDAACAAYPCHVIRSTTP